MDNRECVESIRRFAVCNVASRTVFGFDPFLAIRTSSKVALLKQTPPHHHTPQHTVCRINRLASRVDLASHRIAWDRIVSHRFASLYPMHTLLAARWF